MAQLACQPARLPRSGPPEHKALAPPVAPPPWGGRVPHLVADLDSYSLLPRRRPSIPGSGGEAAHAPPPRGVPRRGPAHGRARRCLGLPFHLPPAPLHSRGLGPARSPVSVPQPGPSSGVFPVAAYTRARPPRPPYQVRAAVRPDTATGPAGGKFPPRKEEGRGGAGPRGGRKSAWRKGRGGGPCSPTGSRWGGRSQGPPPPVLTTRLVTKHP